MAMVSRSQLAAKALHQQGVDTFFYLTGGPIGHLSSESVKLGMRGVDVRHEQGAAMMAHAYARVLNRPGVCMGASGPGTTNLLTGVANAWSDCAPLVVLGGASPLNGFQRGAFQEMDQLSMFRPISKWADRVLQAERLPEYVSIAFRHVKNGRPGPVYLDLPGDVLYGDDVDEDQVNFPDVSRSRPGGRAPGDPDLVKEAVKLLSQAKRPIVLTGSGVLWSGASEQLQQLVDMAGIPFYTTPMGRGVIPDDHELSFLGARSAAFREADCVLVVGTRLNFMVGYAQAPRFSGDAKVIQIDIEPEEVGHNRAIDVGIVGDAAAVLAQLAAEGEGRLNPKLYADWVARLRQSDSRRRAEQEVAMSTDQTPIHPLRLCKEVRDFVDRDAILCVDGQEILNLARQSIPTFVAGHRLNTGVAGNIGVAVPFGVGAKVAKPNNQVISLSGDGSFGMNGMEMDTAARNGIALVTVISNNGGWTADRGGDKVGRNLAFTRYDKLAETFGCHGENVERPEDIRPALERAFKSGVASVINVMTDPNVRAHTQKFTTYRGPAA